MQTIPPSTHQAHVWDGLALDSADRVLQMAQSYTPQQTYPPALLDARASRLQSGHILSVIRMSLQASCMQCYYIQ